MFLKIVKAGFFLIVIALFFSSVWVSLEFYSPRRITPERIFFEVEKGKAAVAIAQELKERGLIRREWPFLLGYRLFYFPASLKAGEYAFQSPVQTKEVLNALTEGKVYLHPLTIPEGLRAKEIAKLFESLRFAQEEDFLEASRETEAIFTWDKEAQNLEGYLFPETYHLSRGTAAKEIVQTMVMQFRSVFSEEWKRRANEINMTIREVVTLASLIEKETSLREEKKLVSAVLHNRLKRGIKLDCDPSIIYVLKQKGNFEGRLRSRDLKLDSPYNTYLYPGLPPGPICNPGRESLEAALYPAEESYLYFVSKNDGSHHFSRTFREHQNAVRKYQK